MPIHVSDPTPRFKVGDRVAVTGPSVHRGKEGIVMQIIGSAGDVVYRYRVRLSEGTKGTFFGFELELISSTK